MSSIRYSTTYLIAQLGVRWNKDTPFVHQTSRFLSLPGELRNLIYEYATEGLVLTHNPANPQNPCTCRYYFANGSLVHYEAGPHALTQVCHQLRKEFLTTLTTSKTTITNMRAARVVDYDSEPLLAHLKRYPGLQSPCQLEIQLQFTQEGAENWHSFLYWLCVCQIDRPCNGSNDDEIMHTIHGHLYHIKFLNEADIIFQRIRLRSRLNLFITEVRQNVQRKWWSYNADIMPRRMDKLFRG